MLDHHCQLGEKLLRRERQCVACGSHLKSKLESSAISLLDAGTPASGQNGATTVKPQKLRKQQTTGNEEGTRFQNNESEQVCEELPRGLSELERQS